MKPGSRVDHDRFCRHEEWELVRNARGGQVRHHVTYEFAVPEGRILRTRVSRPVSTVVYGPRLWSAILRDQLEATESQFWSCVKNRIKPDRGGSSSAEPANALPAQLVYQLIHLARVREGDVAGMTLDDAIRAMGEYWSRPPG